MAKIGFIGSGNMAEALIKGIITAKAFLPCDVLISDIRIERMEQLAGEYGVVAAKSNVDLAKTVDTVVLSVKPQNMFEVLDEIKGSVRDGAVVISIAAGIRAEKISSVLGNAQVIRVMPNTPALIGEGMSALYSDNASDDAMGHAWTLLGSVGKAIVVESEDLIDVVTAISGSGPAYFFLLMEEMVKTAKHLGLSDDVAMDLVLQTAKGASMLAERSEGSPAELREMVTSPGGTTEAALNVFAGKGFGETVMEALTAARDRSRELSG